MDIIEWAKSEIKLAQKLENPYWDGKSFDYGCACYNSAFKALKSLAEDDHSGASIVFTTNILLRLIEKKPLTEITDKDFDESKLEFCENEEFLKDAGLKSCIRCYRYTSLYRKEYLDGTIKYSDSSRVLCIDEDKASYRSSFITSLIDKLYPIKMPYYPPLNMYNYIVDTESFLTDKANGDFDTIAIYTVKKPNGDIDNINRYYKADGDEPWVEINLYEFNERTKHLIIKD